MCKGKKERSIGLYGQIMENKKIIDGVPYKLCACGTCGEYLIEHKTSSGKDARFIKGHYSRGRKQSEETKEKNRQSHIGRIPWNKGKTGIYSDETLDKIRKARKKQIMPKGRKHTEESKEKNRIAHLGNRATKISKKKASLALTGVPKSKKHKANISKSKTGKGNPAWKGGISWLPYPQDWTDDLKDAVRKRDGGACQVCGIHQDDIDYKLPVHHIDYDKENCDPKNLVTLCRSCHGKTAFKRRQWRIHFEDGLHLAEVNKNH